MMFRGRRYPKGTKILKEVTASEGIATRYFRLIEKLVWMMHKEFREAIEDAYQERPPALAEDDKRSDRLSTAEMAAAVASRATAAKTLSRAVRDMVRRWEDRFDDAAEELAIYFATEVENRSSAGLARILREGGWMVKFRMTPAMRDVAASTVQQNVALIKSIPRQYHDQVEQMVMQSVQRGGDLAQLSRDLQQRFDVTRNRAELIARDQNRKATAAFTRVRRLEVGLDKAVWMHSHAGVTPRPTHVKMNGRTFDVAKGMWDSAEQRYIQPGELINCRCSSRPVVQGFS